MPAIEQFQALVELKKFDTAGEIPFHAIVRAMPNLKEKRAFLKEMDAAAEMRGEEAGAARAQAAQEAQALQLRGAQAEVAETESKAALNVAKARDIERGHAQTSPFAGYVGAHRPHEQTPQSGGFTADEPCQGSGECSCSHRA